MKKQPAISTPGVQPRRFRAIPIADLCPALSIVRQRIAIPLLLLGAGLMLVQQSAGQSGNWTETGSLADGRYAHTATLLPNGKVLVEAGLDDEFFCLPSAELYDPMSGTWTVTGAGLGCIHPATLLPNGKVLAEGGYDRDSGRAFTTAQLYDPATGTWTATGSMGTGRGSHTATLLPNGKVLVAGGFDGEFSIVSAELYDPTSGTWTATGSLITARDSHTATLLSTGKVLVVGGGSARTELYDPATGTWTATGSLAKARDSHTATLLPDGQVLVVGGYDSTVGSLANAELYDPARGTWAETGSLAKGRYGHTATLLPNGLVLAAGGVDSSFGYLASSELYDPAKATWAATGDLVVARGGHTATLLPNGDVLAAAGSSNTDDASASAELYSSDGSGGLTVVGAASRKMHSDAGRFDIDLPLSGTPGVECRVGNGGPFLQTIVFTFSEPVTSISGATTTSCGRVNSTTISGSTVTVELGHVNCDGSDINVTVPGVNGASGSVDASATMTLRTGDVNADGVVNNTDLKEIRMNVGRGLVNEDNFRDDITVDGKVNHGDTTLEKSKL